MSYVDSNLLEGESVLYRTRLHWKLFVAPVLFALIVAIAVASIALYGTWNAFAWIPVAVALLWLLARFIKRQTSEFVVTNKRVLMKVGVFTTRSIELLLSTDDGMPANELRKILGGSYKTAWFVEHRIRAALCSAPQGRRRLRGEPRLVVERTYAAAQVGRYHQLGLKYLHAYQTEKSWRARHRHNPNAFRDTVIALLHAHPLSLDELVALDSVATSPAR